MPLRVILLRGVNVGGHNIVRMAEFRSALEAAGFQAVQTYIQSGNAVVASDRPAAAVAAQVTELLRDRFDVRAEVLVLEDTRLKAVCDATPFNGDPSRIYIHFCLAPLPQDFDQSPLAAVRRETETLHLTEAAIYLDAPDGIGRSKLAEKLPRLVPVGLTTRNLRTVRKLVDMCNTDDR